MRRPLCAFCLSALGVLALCSFLPQMGLLLPSAAIFVVFCLLVWWKGGAARGYAVCLLLGAVLGVGIMEMTGARLAKIQDAYAGRDVTLTAEVESTGRAYTAGRVSAVLMVEKVDGEAVHFRVECASLPKCEAGGRIRGRFSLDVPDATQRLDDYADGIVLSAEYLSGMLRLGQSESFRARTALLLVGITGATPSVLRAAVAVWVSSLGVWVGGPADTLTSLGAAGVLMCLGNGYAVYDVGFELSFAAVMGTLAGAECAGRGRERYYDRKKKRKSRREKPPRAVLLFRHFAGGVWDSLCVSLCASAATFPVLVLRGMSTTVWAVASGVAVLWLVGPMLSFGLGAALLGLAAEGLPLFEIIRRPVAFCAEGLAWLMNEWAFRVSVLPGASLWFDGTYAALVCLALIPLCVMAMRRHIRLRVALPTVILLAALAIGLETALSWNVVNIELVGTRAAPAVVITQREKAIVLFRGSSITQRAVENQLEKRGVRTVELLVDLRMQPEMRCTLQVEKRINAAALAENTTRRASCGEVDLELFRTRQGCILRMRVGGQRFITLSGTVRPAKPIRAEWLLASMARPDNIRYTDCLTLSSKYRWMEEDAEPVSRLRLRLEGGALFKAGRV